MEELAVLTEIAKKLITNYLPGPLTIVVEKKPTISNLLTAGKQTVAIRIPNNIFTLKLLRTFGPLTVTSANIHKMDTPVTIKEIKTLFPVSSISIFIDDGPCNSRPSTIVDCTKNHPKILREGIISIHDILSME
jgi:L-threonylcarbamoyladenylate synthase